MKFILALLALLIGPAWADNQLSIMGVSNTKVSGAGMTTPMLALGVGSVPSTTVNSALFPFGTSVAGWSTLPQARWMPVPVAGTISNLEVLLPTAVAANYYTIGLYKNSIATSLQCSVGQAGVNLGTTTTCSDSTDVVSVAPGDIIALESSVPGGTPTTLVGNTSTTMSFKALGQNSPVGAGAVGNPSTGVVNFFSLGFSGVAQTTDAAASAVMPVAGTFNNLQAKLSGAAGSGRSYQIIAFKNGSATALVAGGTSAACGGTSSTACADLADSFSVVAGDTVSVEICPSGVATCPAGSVPAVVSVAASMNFIPATANQALLFDMPMTMPSSANTTNHFMPVGGTIISAATTTETGNQNIAPILTTHMTLGNLYVAQCPGPDTSGSGVSRSFTLRASGSSQTPTVTVPASTTACPTLSTAQDTTHTYQATTATLLDLLTTINTTTNAAALTELKTAMTVTVP